MDSSNEGKEIYGNQLETIETIKVKCKKLDDYLKEERIDDVDLIKLDLQGSELDAIREVLNHSKKVKLNMYCVRFYSKDIMILNLPPTKYLMS